MKRDQIDFHEVRPEHLAIHDRLLNWARWCCGGSRGSDVLPMFRGYKPERYPEANPWIPVDSLDGHRLEKLVVTLPEKHRTLLQWWYVRPYIPVHRVRKALGLTERDLHEMLHSARTMVKNLAARG